MKFDKQDFLIGFAGKPNRLYHVSFLTYAVIVLCGAAMLALTGHNNAVSKPYVYVVFFTALMLTLFIEKSFRTQPLEKHVTAFRLGLFLLLNALFVMLAGGLELFLLDHAILVSSLLFVPSLVMIITACNYFITYINVSYKSAVDLSLNDELTGLPNRRYLNLILRELENKAGTVCALDIDHFKRINDTFGHETGDKVLTTLGLILNNFISNDIFIARSGGEEFCLVLSDRIDPDATIGAIKAALTVPYNQDISITISAGVAHKRRSEPCSQALIAADDALYRAKRAGRDCIVTAR